MSQIVNIFRKDCRHFWPEILATCTLSALLVWVYPFVWINGDLSNPVVQFARLDARHREILAYVVMVLLPLSWLLLISRAVHDENLIGNRQFWLTRPYDWRRLLSSKLLFMLSFISLPLLAAQIVILAREGFAPLLFLPGLFYCTLVLFIFAVLPFFSFAAVLSSLLRMILVLLAIAAILCIAAFFSSGADNSPSVQLPFNSDLVVLPVMAAFCSAVVIVQYSRRRAWLARGLLLTMIATFYLVAEDPIDVDLLKSSYPLVAQEPSTGLRIVFSQDSGPGNGEFAGYGRPGKDLTITLKARAVGIPPGHSLAVDNIRGSLTTPDGTTWHSPWRAVFDQRVSATQPEVSVPLTLTGSIPVAMRSQPIHYEVEVALTEAAPGVPQTFRIPPSGTIDVPGFGICVSERGHAQYTPSLTCRLPLRSPNLTLVEVQPQQEPCGTMPSPGKPTESAFSWVGYLGGAPAALSLVPVVNQYVAFSHPLGDHDSYVCTGTRVRFTPYHLERRFRYGFSFLTTPMKVAPVKPGQK